MHIRPFQDSELARLQEITLEGFDGVSIDQNIDRLWGPLRGRDWRWRKARDVAADCAAADGSVWVAEEDGQVIGYISLRIDREAGLGWIPNLAVDARYRGQGIGRQLILHALSVFRDAGLSAARIETLDQNPIGQQLYPRLGFHEVARQIHYCMPLKIDDAEEVTGDDA